jgi:DNA-binding transcriptional MerR regulator
MPGIPNKLYFRIGEVAKLIGVEPYVLRYWESEFPDIKPSKSKSGQRLYKRRDVEMLVKIKELLYEERYTINGAKKRLKEPGEAMPEMKDEPVAQKREKQIEAFPVESVSGKKGAKEGEGQISTTCAKTLVKIKRDLESILVMMKD